MQYSRPAPFKEALSASRVKTLMPTGMSSAELSQLRGDVLERARFSARVRSATHLDVLESGVNTILEGKGDIATARLGLKQFLQGTGYVPSSEDRGTLKDFSSDARTNLQLEMNVQMAQGYGYWKQGQNEDLLWAFPASELVRVEARRVPRTDWPDRWNAARTATTAEGATDAKSGRMVALKNHPIWTEISRFKQPYEPFDYGSGMGTVDRTRKEAIALGLLQADTVVPPTDRPFNRDLQASPEIRSASLRSLLEQSGIGRFVGDVFVAAGGKGSS